jgi:predicted amidohydrolase
MRVAVIQLNSKNDRETNVQNALRLVDQAAGQGSQFVLLPEYTTFVGGYEGYPVNAEPVPGPTSTRLSAKAKEHGIYLHGGSLIETTPDPARFYNTSLLYDPSGELMAMYRKIHLFDIDVPDEVTEMESRVVLPGDRLVAVDLPDFRLGLSICFDVRFPELYRTLAVAGAEVMVIPAAFANSTGKVHWEILLRARAIENHAYILAPAQCGQDASGSWCYGHSMIVDPWGSILAEAPGEGEAVLVRDIDAEHARIRRNQIQVLNLRKPQIYRKAPELGGKVV